MKVLALGAVALAAAAAIVAVLGIVVVVEARSLGASWTSDGPGAGYFPFYIGLILVVCGAAIFVQALRARGGETAQFDRVLATQFGHHAAQLLIKGQLNEMVTLQGERCTSVPLSAVAGGTRQVPDDHPVMQAAKGMGISLGVRE